MEEKKRKESEDYLRKHNIKALMEDLCSEIAYKQPSDVRAFLIEQLELRLLRKTTTLPIFTETEVENIFNLYNLKGDDFITKDNAIQALNCIAHSDQDVQSLKGFKNWPDSLNLENFKELAREIMGLKF